MLPNSRRPARSIPSTPSRRPSAGPAPDEAGPSTSNFLLLDSEPDAFVFGGWKNVLLVNWARAANGPAVERLGRAAVEFSKRVPGRRSSVHLVQAQAGLPLPEARTAFVDLMKRDADSLGCVAVVLGGTGFWSGALRAAITGMRLLSPRSFDLRLLDTIEEVARWLPSEHGRRTGVHLEPLELRSVLEDLQREGCGPRR